MAGPDPERKSVVSSQDWSEGPVSQAQNPFLQLLTQEKAPGAHICSYMMFTENERLIWRRNSQEMIMEWLYLRAQNYGDQITLCPGNDRAQTHHSSTALLLLRPITDVLVWSWRVIPGCRGSTGRRTWLNLLLHFHGHFLALFCCATLCAWGTQGWGDWDDEQDPLSLQTTEKELLWFPAQLQGWEPTWLLLVLHPGMFSRCSPADNRKQISLFTPRPQESSSWENARIFSHKPNHHNRFWVPQAGQ